jgi:hypothetical protein
LQHGRLRVCQCHTLRTLNPGSATTKLALDGALTTLLCLFAAGVHMDDRDREYADVALFAQELSPRARDALAQPTAAERGNFLVTNLRFYMFSVCSTALLPGWTHMALVSTSAS